MTDIKKISEFIEHYKNGQRLFVDLEFENGESFSGLDISGTTFKNCWFCADFSNANLTDCKFIDSNIKTSDFTNANLTRAEIKGCAVESTEYNGATITDFKFEDNSAYGNILGLNDFKRIFDFEK
ncbi:MAG TPA: pentapeptide repeat-containing protein [Flavobacteriales bacterium]|nr:pentapeptide repeat-containing protein [Flavobacteriales bacterium]HRE97298.1 pentapeptide repeat-containing protein [Flavobacteriales bacterium]